MKNIKLNKLVIVLLSAAVVLSSITACNNAGAATSNSLSNLGSAESATISSLAEIQGYIDQVKPSITSPQQLCMIYDMDNTILSAEPKLGSDSWMTWNNGLANTDPEKISNWNLTSDLHGFEGALRFFIKYYPTESVTVATINNIKDDQHYPSIVMTARSYERYYAATENQLKANKLDYTSNPIGKTASFYTPITLTPNKDHTAYKAYFNGVYYSADDSKGSEILEFIKWQRKETGNNNLCRALIFVDNSKTNVDHVYTTFKNNQNNVNVIALRYSAYDAYLIPSLVTIDSWLITNGQSASNRLYDLIQKLN